MKHNTKAQRFILHRDFLKMSMIKIFPKYFISVTKGSKLLSDMRAITAHNQKASTCPSQASPTFKKRRKKRKGHL